MAQTKEQILNKQRQYQLNYKKKPHTKRPVEEKTMLFLPQDTVEKRNICVHNQIIKIACVDDDDFYNWFLELIEAVRKTVLRPDRHNELPALKRRARELKYELDNDSRWYLINELYRLKSFRQSGIAMFASEVRV